MTIEKIKILGAVLELLAKQHCQFLPIQPIHLKSGPNGLNWQCCIVGSSKTAPRILIFSTAMGADYSFELISIETYAPQFIGHNKFSLGSVPMRGSNWQKDSFLTPILFELCLFRYLALSTYFWDTLYLL